MSEKKEIIIIKKIETEALQGQVELVALTYPERIAISKESVTDIADTEKGFETKAKQDLDRAQSYYQVACKQAKNVNVKIVPEDRVVTTIDELMVYEEGTAFVMELAAALIGGVTLGNGKQKTSEEIA